MFVKIISNEETRIIECNDVRFQSKGQSQTVIIDGLPHDFEGKAYVMNGAGITVDSYPSRTGR